MLGQGQPPAIEHHARIVATGQDVLYSVKLHATQNT